MTPRQGAFFGLSRAHDRREITRAVVEGVAFALADAVDVLRAQAQGHRHCWQPVAEREADNGCKLLQP